PSKRLKFGRQTGGNERVPKDHMGHATGEHGALLLGMAPPNDTTINPSHLQHGAACAAPRAPRPSGPIIQAKSRAICPSKEQSLGNRRTAFVRQLNISSRKSQRAPCAPTSKSCNLPLGKLTKPPFLLISH